MLTQLHRQRFCGVLGIEYNGQHPPGFEDEIVQCIAFLNNMAEELDAT